MIKVELPRSLLAFYAGCEPQGIPLSIKIKAIKALAADKSQLITVELTAPEVAAVAKAFMTVWQGKEACV